MGLVGKFGRDPAWRADWWGRGNVGCEKVEELYKLEYENSIRYTLEERSKGRTEIIDHEYFVYDTLRRNRFSALSEWNSCEKDRKEFISILDQIIEGKSIDKISGLECLIKEMPKTIRQFAVVRDKRSHNKKLIRRIEIEEEDKINGSHIPNFFNGAVTKSLIYFLVTNDRRRIKKCKICQEYFSAQNTQREVCYRPKDCEKILRRNNQRELMRKKRNKNGNEKEFDPKYL